MVRDAVKLRDEERKHVSTSRPLLLSACADVMLTRAYASRSGAGPGTGTHASSGQATRVVGRTDDEGRADISPSGPGTPRRRPCPAPLAHGQTPASAGILGSRRLTSGRR